MHIVLVLARQRADALAPRRAAKPPARMLAAALVFVRVVSVEMVGVCAEIRTVDDSTLHSAAKLVNVVARMFVRMLAVHFTGCCTIFRAAQFGTRVQLLAVVQAVLVEVVVVICVGALSSAIHYCTFLGASVVQPTPVPSMNCFAFCGNEFALSPAYAWSLARVAAPTAMN